MLGSDVVRALDKHCIEYIASDSSVDITDDKALYEFAEGKDITAIINCAAYTAVDKAEDETLKAHMVNGVGAENVASIANRLGATVFYISTDYVFNGEAVGPISETYYTDPINAYGASKLEGENKTRAISSKYFIIRTAWLYGMNGKSFVSTMLNLMSNIRKLGVVRDQFGTPTWTVDLAEVIVTMLRSGSEEYGVYHYTNEGDTNWSSFARKISEVSAELGLIPDYCVIDPISFKEYPIRTRRPSYSVLDKSKIRDTFGIEIPQWDTSLNKFLEELYRKKFEC